MYRVLRGSKQGSEVREVSASYSVSLKKKLLFIMCMDILPGCMYVYHMPACVHRDEKVALDPLELGLRMVVNHHLGARNWAWSSDKVTSTLNH